eukprot:6174217-Pleurochrysis_carterae.AAC.1
MDAFPLLRERSVHLCTTRHCTQVAFVYPQVVALRHVRYCREGLLCERNVAATASTLPLCDDVHATVRVRRGNFRNLKRSESPDADGDATEKHFSL